jgi:NAD-reducing hydrogenase large subunit
VINLAQILQSHALSFFYLSSPDLLLGMDADPATRNLVGVLAAEPEFARGRHPAPAVRPADHRAARRQAHPSRVGRAGRRERTARRDDPRLDSRVAPRDATARRETLTDFKRRLEQFREEIRSFANFPSLFLALVDDSGRLDFYDGHLRFVDARGDVVADGIDPTAYAAHIAKPSSRGRTSSRRTTCRRATRTASTASARSRGSTSPTDAARRSPIRSGPSSATSNAARC